MSPGAALAGPALYLVVALGATLAGFVQGLSGFAFGVVAISVWAWTIDPALAGVLATFGALCGQVLSAFTVRRGFEWRVLAPYIAGGLVGVPFGVWLLPRLDVVMFKAALGAFLVVWCSAMLLARRVPRITAGGRWADALSGLVGGVCGGIAGLSGPAPTLWCTLRGLGKESQRAVVQNFSLTMLAVAFTLQTAAGHVTASMLPLLAIVAVCVLVPVRIGARIYTGINDQAFRQIVLGLLTLSGLALLLAAVPDLLRRG